MHSFDNDFFEAYKRLDNICSDLYSTRNGISEYITDMETKASQGHLLIPSWDSDYKSLKHIRWVRNRIAHDADDSQISEPSDLSFAKDFHHRILSEKDPLTLHRKAGAKQKRTQADQQPRSALDQSLQQTRTPVQQPERSYKLSPVLVVLILILLVLVLFIIRLKLLR